MNVEPTHGSLSTRKRPAHRLDQELRKGEAEPGALDRGLLGAEPVERGEDLCELSSAMPWPVSVTMSITRSSETSSSEIVTDPPSRLYLIPFESRLSSTCFSRCLSAWT